MASTVPPPQPTHSLPPSPVCQAQGGPEASLQQPAFRCYSPKGRAEGILPEGGWPLRLLGAGFTPQVEPKPPTTPASPLTSKISMGWWVREKRSSGLAQLSLFSGICHPHPVLEKVPPLSTRPKTRPYPATLGRPAAKPLMESQLFPLPHSHPLHPPQP